MLGLGTLLITELPRQPDQAASLISTALIFVGGFGTLVGLGFVLLVPYVSPNFQPLRANAGVIIVFSSGVGLTAIALALDQALVGLLRAERQLWRNTFFAIVKLALLFVVGLWASQKIWTAIYLTWIIGIALSLISLLRHIKPNEKRPVRAYLPQWRFVRKLGPNALQHYMLNMILQVPIQMLPILVTTLLSTRENAWFFVSDMIASFVFFVPNALTMVLHAMNSARPSSLSQKIRVTIGIALVACTLANLLLQFGTKQVLGLFGQTYVDQAAWCLRILALCSFPLIVRYHYMSICRIQDRITHAMLSMAPGGLLELVAAALGAHFAGLTGLALGWLLVLCIEAVYMLPTIYKTLRSSQISPQVANREEAIVIEPIWLIDTVVVPSIIRGPAALDASYLEPLPLPPIKPAMNNTLTKLYKIPGFRKMNTATSRRNLHPKPIRLRPYTSHPESTFTKDTPATDQTVTSKLSSSTSSTASHT